VSCSALALALELAPQIGGGSRERVQQDQEEGRKEAGPGKPPADPESRLRPI